MQLSASVILAAVALYAGQSSAAWLTYPKLPARPGRPVNAAASRGSCSPGGKPSAAYRPCTMTRDQVEWDCKDGVKVSRRGGQVSVATSGRRATVRINCHVTKSASDMLTCSNNAQGQFEGYFNCLPVDNDQIDVQVSLA
ncbi:hypothetical protein E4U53_006496 [Claviceps sorghi]|nr:hypothetical protein E4U53_006496 [Claviceps sorghi]